MANSLVLCTLSPRWSAGIGRIALLVDILFLMKINLLHCVILKRCRGAVENRIVPGLGKNIELPDYFLKPHLEQKPRWGLGVG